MRLLPEDGAWHGHLPPWEATDALLHRLEDQHLPEPPKHEGYDWQPLGLVDFMAGMGVAGWQRGRRFLDVGSGIGSKLYLARTLGWEARGVEIHEPYAEVSRRLFPECPVTVEDAFTFDGYGAFDLVYCYQLYEDEKRQCDLNTIIVPQLRSGALYFTVGPDPEGLASVGYQVWKA